MFTKSITALAAVVFMFGCCSSMEEFRQPPETRFISDSVNVEHLMDTTVALLNPENIGEDIVCTGFYISADVIMTARHCLDMGNKDELEKRQEKALNTLFPVVNYRAFTEESDGSIVMTEVLLYPSKETGSVINYHDIALLKLRKTEPKSKHWLKFADAEPKLGEKVFGVSMPGGKPWIITAGIVGQHIRTGYGVPSSYMVVTIPIDFGSSGSALVNNKGEVVGIAHLTDRTYNMPLYISVDPMRRFAYGFVD